MPGTTSQFKLQLWRERFEQFRSNQQTVQQFCQSLACTPATFYYWKRKLQSTGRPTPGQLAPSRSTPRTIPTSAFVPVVLRGNTSSPVVVRVKDGTRIRLPVDALAALAVILQHAQRVAQ